MKKYIIVVIAFISLMIVAVLLTFIRFIYPHGIIMPNQNKMNKIFQENQTELQYIGDYLREMQYDKVLIDSDNIENMKCYESNGQYRIEENSAIVKSYLSNLRDKGFLIILKENNYVLFERWISFGASCGILYCRDYEPVFEETSGEREIYKMEMNGWYYYKYIE